jgi:hypothetical protein
MAQNQTNDVVQPRPEFPPPPKPQELGALTNPPRSPLQGPHALQWQRCLQLIRNKNRAAQTNGGKRVPLT